MDMKELRSKPAAELQKLIKAQREQLRDLRFKVAAKQHKDVRDLRDTRTSIAQILTVLKEKEYVKSTTRTHAASTKPKA
ncbi:MAG: 50S ribosomal protein L29 [Patescibacteria group bacterium]